MIEADNDEDFFTPSSGTSLADIFGTKLTDNTKDPENSTLKYVAPKAGNSNVKQHSCVDLQSDSGQLDNTLKTSKCIFALAVFAYEFLNNVYIPRGKLGFAIMKLYTPLQTKLVLYDSNKTTLSTVNISANLGVIIQDNKYINYYDDLKKNWSLSCHDIGELKLIIQKFQEFDVNIKFQEENLTMSPAIQPKPNIINKDFKVPEILKDLSDKGSDTDSSINRKTKASLLNRMALMGQSVLPAAPAADKTSDSSDNDPDPHFKTTRHKPHKNNIKRSSVEKNAVELITVPRTDYSVNATFSSSILNTPVQITEEMEKGTDLKRQLVAFTNFSQENKQDVEHLISENRINNTELRININRLTDKVDLVLNKIKHVENKPEIQNVSDFTKDIFQKLLSEYENRIKEQNDKIKQLESMIYQNVTDTKLDSSSLEQKNVENIETSKFQTLDIQITKLVNENDKKSNEIAFLKDEIIRSKNNLKSKNEMIDDLQNKNNSLINELNEKNKELGSLRGNFQTVYEEMNELKQKFENHLVTPDDQLHMRIKSIMNDTFRSLASNFENNTSYRGDTIKAIVATVIKKATMEVIKS